MNYAPLKDKNRNEHALQERIRDMIRSQKQQISKYLPAMSPFPQKFKYLGSRILYNLRDDDGINARLATASQSMDLCKRSGTTPILTRTANSFCFAQSPSIYNCGHVRTGLCNNPYYVNLKSSSIGIYDGYLTSR
jgi:hypothetical protein